MLLATTLFAGLFFGDIALAGLQAEPGTEATLRAAPLEVAYGWCSGDAGSEWGPADPEDPYVAGVQSYWEESGKRTGDDHKQVFFRGLGRDGEPNGLYLQHVMVGTLRSGQHSCIVHFPERAPPNVGPAELELFAQSKPTQVLIPLLWNETSWEAWLPKRSSYDYLRITSFAPGEKPKASYPDHPFRGTQFRFLKTGGL